MSAGLLSRRAESTPRPRRRTALPAALAALVAVGCALLMPFAPVSVQEPTVSWPRDPAHPVSTLLALTAYRPLAMEVRFTCEVARLARATGDGVVVATALPGSPQAGTSGMVVAAVGDRIQVRALDRLLLDEPVPAGACTYRISGTSESTSAGPHDAELLITRDGAELVRATAEQLPDVDVLVTSLTDVPAGGLAVELRVDDEFTSSPTSLKLALTAALVLALLATAVLLARVDAAVPRERVGWRPGWPRVVDVVVPAVLLCWLFVAPATDDDGYFATQARNAAITGEVGNYYQFHDQSFVPFTWAYQALGAWQQLVGYTPVLQRIPALVCGLLTWLVVRRLAAAASAESATPVRGVHAVLGVVFLAWWLPYGMGVRPEALVALCGAATLLAVLVAGRRRRLGVAWLAFALAGVGFTVHTTGVTMLAPLLAGLPLLLPLVHVAGDRTGTAARVLAVGSGAMTAPLLGFADGALRDFLRGQALFLSFLRQQGWADEFERYAHLLDQVSMGNFAKRAAVLACLVALGWFAVLAVAARMSRTPLPTSLWLAGTSTALSFAALALTPSKWTHHFGALAGVGSVFLGLLLVTAVPLTRQLLRGARLPLGVPVVAAGSAVAAVALAWHGPNSWPYAWLAGVRTPDEPPSVGGVPLDGPLLWGLVLAAGVLASVLWGRRRGTPDRRLDALRAVPLLVVGSLAATTVYAVGTFGVAAAHGVPRESVWARALAEPTGCGAAEAVRVLDPFTAEPLPAAADLPVPPPPTPFVAGGGFYPNNRPQALGDRQVWGSLVDDGTGTADQTTGEMTTGWFTLPAGTPNGAAVTVTAAGTLSAGNSLTAVYGRRSGDPADTVLPAGSEPLVDTARSPSWRTLVLTPPADADVVSLRAVDATGAIHGWLAFSAPATARPVVLGEFLPDDTPVALGWQLAFGYPCLRPPAIVDGITEPPTHAVLWGPDEALSGLDDIAWRVDRGGLFGQVARSRSVLQLATVGPVDPHIQVYVLGTDLAREAYRVSVSRRTVPGASTATG